MLAGVATATSFRQAAILLASDRLESDTQSLEMSQSSEASARTVDRLSGLLQQFALSARVFYSGRLCGTARFDEETGAGHLHVLRAGRLDLVDARGEARRLRGPSLLFFARPAPHRLAAVEDEEAELLCASVAFGSGGDPISVALPCPLVLELGRAPMLASLVELLFEEAFAQRCGRAIALDRLTELLVLNLLRQVMADGVAEGGLLAGLADPRLSKALAAIHAAPERAWTLESMAAAAGMSRARFAAHFLRTLGQTPMDYLTAWRVGIAMGLLKRGLAVGQVAGAVGYASASALARVFSVRIGSSPLAWLKSQQAVDAASVSPTS
jgi:AraC-like DNA-binding protein